MSKFLQAFVVFLFWSFFAILFHFYISIKLLGNCNINYDAKSKEVSIHPIITSENDSNLIKVTDEKGVPKFAIKGAFKIKMNADLVLIDESLNKLKDSVTSFLAKNPSKNLIIVSSYLNNEVNSTSGVNYGQLRGNYVKNWFLNDTVTADRIRIETQLSDYTFDKNGEFNQAISLYFKDLSSTKSGNLSDVVTKKNLRFSFGNQSFKPTPELEDYVLELKSYLGQYPDKKVYITGHTDSEGDETYNFNIGLQRAQFVKDFLISQEIEPYKIISASKGESEPLADNRTREGKSINRRIEIIIK